MNEWRQWMMGWNDAKFYTIHMLMTALQSLHVNSLAQQGIQSLHKKLYLSMQVQKRATFFYVRVLFLLPSSACPPEGVCLRRYARKRALWARRGLTARQTVALLLWVIVGCFSACHCCCCCPSSLWSFPAQKFMNHKYTEVGGLVTAEYETSHLR